MKTRPQSATLATCIALGCFLVALPLTGFGSALAAACLMLLGSYAGLRLDAASIEDHARKSRNRVKPGQMWNKDLRRWEGGPCSKHKAHTACGYCGGDRARNRNRPHAVIEDPIDAAVAAWRTVYGEDIGYNEHSATLAKLGAWHDANDLTTDQLVDCSASVEWITWSLGQPEQDRTFAEREGRRKLLPHPAAFDQDQYARDVDRFTHMARPSGYNVKLDRRVDAETFERLRGEFKAKHDGYRMPVLESGIHPCNGCRTETLVKANGFQEAYSYCDGSHTQKQSLADTIPETATEGW